MYLYIYVCVLFVFSFEFSKLKLQLIKSILRKNQQMCLHNYQLFLHIIVDIVVHWFCYIMHNITVCYNVVIIFAPDDRVHKIYSSND